MQMEVNDGVEEMEDRASMSWGEGHIFVPKSIHRETRAGNGSRPVGGRVLIDESVNIVILLHLLSEDTRGLHTLEYQLRHDLRREHKQVLYTRDSNIQTEAPRHKTNFGKGFGNFVQVSVQSKGLEYPPLWCGKTGWRQIS